MSKFTWRARLWLFAVSLLLAGCPQPEFKLNPTAVTATQSLVKASPVVGDNNLFGPFPVQSMDGDLQISSPYLFLQVNQRVRVAWNVRVGEDNRFIVDLGETSLVSDSKLPLRISSVRLTDVERNQTLLATNAAPQQLRLPAGLMNLEMVYFTSVPVTNASVRPLLSLRDRDKPLSVEWECRR